MPGLQHHTPEEIAQDVTNVRRRIVRRRLPDAEQYRTYFGRSLDMARIESAIRDSSMGLMTRLCDLEEETVQLDPHFGGLLGKRFGAMEAVEWSIDPATGPDIDKQLARDIADETRYQLQRIPDFGQHIYDLAWAEFDGRAALENHWEFRTGKVPWRLRELGWVHPRRLAFGPERELLLINTWHERANFVEQGVRLADHPAKFITWQPRLFRAYPENEGLGIRGIYWSFMKRFNARQRMALNELYAYGWRIVSAEKDSDVGPEQLQEAADIVQHLGRDTTANLGRAGVKLDVVWPGESSGTLIGMTEDACDKQLSKLVLGNTGTTETDQGNRAGMIVAKGEQDIIAHRTGAGISRQVTAQACLPICVLNWGPDNAAHAARFRLRTEPPRDRDKDMGVLERSLKMQVPVAVSEVREVTGFREPEEDEAYAIGAGATTDAMGNPVPDAVRIVDPQNPDEAAAALPAREDRGVPGAANDTEGEEPKAATVTAAGLVDLCRAAGVELTREGAAALVAIPEPMRAGILERILEDRRRPLDP